MLSRQHDLDELLAVRSSHDPDEQLRAIEQAISWEEHLGFSNASFADVAVSTSDLLERNIVPCAKYNDIQCTCVTTEMLSVLAVSIFARASRTT